MGKIASAIVAVTLLTSPLLLPVPASAENGQIAAGRSGRTYRRGVARRRSGSTASSASAAGLLCAGAGLRRRACLPSGSGALLGWIWLAISSSPGLRLIAARFGRSRRELTQVNQLEANWAPLFPALGHAQPWRVATSAASLPPVAVPRSPAKIPLLCTIPSSKISDHIGVPSAHRLDVRLGCAPCKGGAFQWVQAPPGNRSSRKQSEQSWR